MRIIGCDLHTRQQTVAMLDTDTGEFVENTLEPMTRNCGSFIPDSLALFWWGSKQPARCSGSWS